MPGACVRIDADPHGNAWLVNGENNVYFLDSKTHKMPNICALDIGVGCNDHVWFTGTDNQIYSYQVVNGKRKHVREDPIGNFKGARNIDVDPEGNPWVVTQDNRLYYYNKTVKKIAEYKHRGEPLPFKVRDVGVGPGGEVWLATNGKDRNVYRLLPGVDLQLYPGLPSARSISVNEDGKAMVLTDDYELYQSLY